MPEWLRLFSTDAVDDLPAWLTTVVTWLCFDQLRKRRTRSAIEAEVPDDHVPVDPEADVLLAERTGDAMQLVLDALAPAERVAFVLHDVFGYPFDEVNAVMGRSSTAVRQLSSRARRKMQGVPEPAASQAARAESRRVVDAFLAAARGGELATLLSLLAPDVVMRADLVGQTLGTDSGYEGASAVAARFNGARGGRQQPRSMVSLVPLGSTPGRPRWSLFSMLRLAWHRRSSSSPTQTSWRPWTSSACGRSREADAHGPLWHSNVSQTK